MELETNNEIKKEKSTSSVAGGISLIFPLFGFVAFGVFIIINKIIFKGGWDKFQTYFMYIFLITTAILGTMSILKGKKSPTDANEFQKIMLANAFSWLGIQSMFVMSYFFIKENIIPGLDSNTVWANSFSYMISGSAQNTENTAGNILSLGFLLLNFIGALLPIFVLEPLSKIMGKIKVYRIAIACMAAGYLLLYVTGSSELIFYTGMIICGIGWSAVISIVFSIMTEKIKANKMGLYMGIFNFSIVLPSMMTPGISKLVKDTGDYSVLFLVIAICLIISFICWCFVKESKTVEVKS